jgi:hypothetical protein
VVRDRRLATPARSWLTSSPRATRDRALSSKKDSIDASLPLCFAQHAAHVKAELPSPRAVEVAPADIVFDVLPN